MNRRPKSRGALLITLILLCPLLGGCGLGWLYMRVADSQRIKATKVLLYDSSKDRFSNSEKLYKKAIDNYNESLLYDETGNPSVFHKKGFTLLMLPSPDVGGAEGSFRDGVRVLKTRLRLDASKPVAGSPSGSGSSAEPPKEGAPVFKREKQDTSETPTKPAATSSSGAKEAEARTDEEIAIDTELAFAETKTSDKGSKNEDYALVNSGLGICHFYKGIREHKDEEFRVAAKYFRLAEKWTAHPSTMKQKAHGFVQKILASLDLDEIVEPTPHSVLLARVHCFQAKKLLERGLDKLATSMLDNAQDALDSVKVFYERDARFVAEQAQVHFLRKEYAKCIGILADLAGTLSYADMKVAQTLKARALIESAKYDDALTVVNDLLDREPDEVGALLLRARIHAAKDKDAFKNVNDDIDAVFAREINKQNVNLLMEAGDVYMGMRGSDNSEKKKAKAYYIQAYYIDPKNIRTNFLLGKAYQALGDQENWHQCFQRVCKIDPSSSYCREVRPLLGAP